MHIVIACKLQRPNSARKSTDGLGVGTQEKERTQKHIYIINYYTVPYTLVLLSFDLSSAYGMQQIMSRIGASNSLIPAYELGARTHPVHAIQSEKGAHVMQKGGHASGTHHSGWSGARARDRSIDRVVSHTLLCGWWS